MIRERDTETEKGIKKKFNINVCFVRGDNLIIKDSFNKKLFHFANFKDGLTKTNQGFEILRA